MGFVPASHVHQVILYYYRLKPPGYNSYAVTNGTSLSELEIVRRLRSVPSERRLMLV